MRNTLLFLFLLSTNLFASGGGSLGGGGGGAAVWGDITGTLSNQTDLQSALNLKAPLASPTLTGTVTVTTLVKGTYHLEPTEVDDGNSGTADTIDWGAGSAHRSTLTGNVTYTFSNPQTGGAYVFKVLTGAGTFTTTWPGTVIWLNPTNAGPPADPAGSNTVLVNFYYDGTNYWGSYASTY